MILFRDTLARDYRARGADASIPVARMRAIANAVRAPWTQGGPAMRETEDRVVLHGGVELRVRLHLPHVAPEGVLAYAHGGGWTMFSLDTHDRVMREYAARANALVVGLDYSLAPEAPFPRALDELAALLRLLRRPGSGLAIGGVDPATLPLAVGGDSAGGNLAIAAALDLRDAQEMSALSAILLNYAVVDPCPNGPSCGLYDGPGFNLEMAEMRRFWDNYIPDKLRRTDPRAAPLQARLAGLPPTFLTIAECDVLASENAALAAALVDAQVHTRSVVYPGMLHSFLEAVSISPTAARAFDDGAAWLRQAFATREV